MADEPLIPGSAAWWQAHASRPRRTSRLTTARIVDAAIRLLDRDGLEGFSMRRLADRLGTSPGSLYRHFESREAVLVAVHDKLIGEIDFEPAGATLAERITNLARSQHRILRERPYLATIWITTEQLGPNALRARERALEFSLATGLPGAVASRAYLTLLHFTIAFAVLEQNLGQRAEEQREATESFFHSLPADEYPAIRELASDLAHVTIEEEFETGLRAVVAVLESLERAADGD